MTNHAHVAPFFFAGFAFAADDDIGASMSGLRMTMVSVRCGGGSGDGLGACFAALGTGQKFDRRGRSSHPTTSTSEVPVDPED